MKGTCIVGIEHKGTVWVGSDTLATNGSEKLVLADAGKVFKIGEDILVGVAGDIRVRDVIRYDVTAPERTDAEDDDQRYLVRCLIPELRLRLREAGAIWSENGSEQAEFSILLGYRGHLYILDDDFSVLRGADGYYSVGSGCEYALGALTVVKGSPHQRITRALEAACKFSPSCGGPFVIERI